MWSETAVLKAEVDRLSNQVADIDPNQDVVGDVFLPEQHGVKLQNVVGDVFLPEQHGVKLQDVIAGVPCEQALAAAGQVAKFCGGKVRPDDIILVTVDPDSLDRDMGDIICVAGIAKPDGGEKYRVEWNSAALSEGVMDHGDCGAPNFAHDEEGLYATFATPDLYFTDRDSAVSCALAIAGRIVEKIDNGVVEGVQVLHAHPKLGIARSARQDLSTEHYDVIHADAGVQLEWDARFGTLHVTGTGRCELGTVRGNLVSTGEEGLDVTAKTVERDAECEGGAQHCQQVLRDAWCDGGTQHCEAVEGNAECHGGTQHCGTVEVDAECRGGTQHCGIVKGDAICEGGTQHCQKAEGNALCYGGEQHCGTVEGNAICNGGEQTVGEQEDADEGVKL